MMIRSRQRNRRRRARIAVAVCALAHAACAQDPPPSIVLITLDTTRADHLGAYGYARARTPELNRFAQGAILYEVAYATSSWTLPAHTSIFTGLLPMQHGAQTAPNGSSRDLGYSVRPLAGHFTTLAEHLTAAGYRTAAVVAGPAMRSELGVAQGFEYYDDEFRNQSVIFNGRRAEVIADRAIDVIERFGAEPFFLFVNFFDPHAPYKPPAPHDRGLTDIRDGPFVLALVDRLRAGAPGRSRDGLEGWERETADAMIAGYDAEIAYLDHQLGRLLDALDESMGPSGVLIAITSDHGESFGEHNFLSHGAHLYEHNVRVPLLVRHPDGRGAGTRVTAAVQNHRLFATILDAAGIPLPEGTAVQALAMRGDRDASESVIVTEVRRSDNNVALFGDVFDRDLRAIYTYPYKLIESSAGGVEIFDLARDAGETENLANSDPELRERLTAQLDEIGAALPPLFDAAKRARLEPETERALRALGYLD